MGSIKFGAQAWYSTCVCVSVCKTIVYSNWLVQSFNHIHHSVLKRLINFWLFFHGRKWKTWPLNLTQIKWLDTFFLFGQITFLFDLIIDIVNEQKKKQQVRMRFMFVVDVGRSVLDRFNSFSADWNLFLVSNHSHSTTWRGTNDQTNNTKTLVMTMMMTTKEKSFEAKKN